MKSCEPLYTTIEFDEKLNLKWIDIMKIADPNMEFIKQPNGDVKVYTDWFGKKPPSKEFMDYLQAIKKYVIDMYEQTGVSITSGNKTRQRIISDFKNYLNLDISSTLIQEDGKKIIYNYSKVGNVINHWFPEIHTTKTLPGKHKEKAHSVIDVILNKKRFPREMIMMLLEERMHYWSKRKIIGQKKLRIFELTIPKEVYEDTIPEKDALIWPKLKNMLKMGLKAHPAGQFPTAPSKFLIKDAIDRTVTQNQGNIRVFDPCAGWAGRFVGMLANFGPNSEYTDKKIDLILNDVNERTDERFPAVLQFWNRYVYDTPQENINLIKKCLPVEDMTRIYMGKDQKLKNHISKVDFAITSPPYFNKEVYEHNNPNQSHNRYGEYDLWTEGFLKPLLKNTYDLLKPGGIFYLNIADVDKLPLQQDALRIADQIGYDLIDTYYIAFAIAMGVNRNKDGQTVNNNMVYCKGKYRKSEPVYLLQKR